MVHWSYNAIERIDNLFLIAQLPLAVTDGQGGILYSKLYKLRCVLIFRIIGVILQPKLNKLKCVLIFRIKRVNNYSVA